MSDCPPAKRRIAERAGDGTEPERLALLREHEERLAGQMRELSRCRDLIAYKVGMYEDLSERGESHRTCRAPAPPS